jgi:hypothetical protein
MLWLWLFWMEAVAFSGFMLWTLMQRPDTQPLTLAQGGNLVLYGVALLYGAYGFLRFASRRIKAAAANKK